MIKKNMERTKVETNGGAFIMGRVHTEGDFIGRDKIGQFDKEQNASLPQLIEQLNKLCDLLNRSGLDSDIAASLANDIQTAKESALNKKPALDTIKSKIKKMQEIIGGLDKTAKSTQSILSILYKAAKIIGISLA